MTLLRIEGARVSVEYRAGALAKLLADIGPAEILSDERVETLWRQVRDAEPLSEPREAAVWRISVAPSRGAEVVAALKRKLAVRVFYDWGGGLIWAAAPSDGDAGSAAVRKALSEAVGEQGGHATLVRAPAEIRSRVDVFEPLAEPLMRISAGIKASFDPDRIFNPGRMYAGI